MMNFDSGVPAERRPAPDLWRLPDVLKVTARRRHFDSPRRVTAAGVDRQASDAIEIEIEVSEPFAIRALGPVLWVGDEPLSAAESPGKNIYRFFSFNPDALQPGAPIALSWGSTGTPKKKETRHRFEAPSLPDSRLPAGSK
jgi:hypothetical protein